MLFIFEIYFRASKARPNLLVVFPFDLDAGPNSVVDHVVAYFDPFRPKHPHSCVEAIMERTTLHV